MTKICTKCSLEKGLGDFAKSPVSKDGYHTWCRMCSNSYSREHYFRNRQKRVHDARVWLYNNWDKKLASGRKLRKARRQVIEDYLLEHPCVDCGEADPIVLEFDHVRGEKLGNISTMLYKDTLKAVFAEIEKCDI